MINKNSSYSPQFGIQTLEGQTVAYMYLCGIRPLRDISINSNITLRSVRPSPNPNDMIENVMKYGDQTEYTLGMVIALLRRISAELVIKADNAKDLAILTWNAQQICVQISAILNCELSFFFQANDSAENFNTHTHINIINPNMLRIPDRLVELDQEKCEYIERYIESAIDLAIDDRYETATTTIWCYKAHFRPAVQLSVIWSGIESLFLIERGIRNKLSKAISRFLIGNDNLIDEIKDLYDSRSKAVHELKNGEEPVLNESVKLLHKLIITCIERNILPDTNNLLNE